MAAKNRTARSHEAANGERSPVGAWWRTYTPNELRTYKDEPETILALAEYVQTDPTHWFQTDGTLAPDRIFFAPNLVKTGLERLRTNVFDDVAGTWFLLAFLLDRRNNLVVLLVRELLLKLAVACSREKGGEARAAERRYVKLVNAWSDLVQTEPDKSFLTEEGLKALSSTWRSVGEDDWYLQGRRSLHSKQREEAEPDEAETETPTEGPTRVVVREIGDPKSVEGKKVVSVYESLVGPLPLIGSGVSAKTLATALTMEFPWMEPAIERLTDDLRLLQATGTIWTRFRPILLVGPPGVGKTRFARKIARLVGTGYQEVNAAGSSDNRMLAGTARGWSSAQPALPLLAMLRGRTANPVCVVDEIDKAGGNDRNGDMRATLLAMLEPETASAWYDECLLCACDLSQVSWILTANDLSGLSPPLLSRLMIVNVDVPAPEHFDALVNGILWDLCHELSVTREQLPELEPNAVEALREHFTRKRSVRTLKNAVTAAMAHGMVKFRSRTH